MSELSSRILIGVTGGIAAYKVADIASALLKNKHYLQIIMTENAKKFITPLTLSTLSHSQIYDDTYESSCGIIQHIVSAKWAEVFVIVPATANTIVKLAMGIADNLLTSTYLAIKQNSVNVIIFPAMNTNMWLSPQVQDSLSILSKRSKHKIIEPEEGLLACGDIGIGKLPGTRKVVEEIQKFLPVKCWN